MDLEKNGEQMLYDGNSDSIYYNHWAINDYQYIIDNYPVKLCTSYSTPLSRSSSSTTKASNQSMEDSREKNQLLRELYQIKKDIIKFKNELNGLARQMDGMEVDLNVSKNRVQEIEEDITATQEVNVNLQVLLERAVNKQKETDVYATREMKNIHSNLANVVYETGQLRWRLTSIANYQRQQQGNVIDVAERIREYSEMLEEAIQSLQRKPRKSITADTKKSSESYATTPTKNNKPINTVNTTTSTTTTTTTVEKRKKTFVDNNELYKHRIIRKRISNPEMNQAWLPQKGLRILLSDSF
ncbi:hypothetical protein BCV72DRAFT_300315 [Rhizopus microsporus var. microsporus]|uniref:Uncharacterized protein n=1 Tax=Rhizopus microsporus var. microsporus TaxID=86635 RepID=A0A1X0RIV5_RHIZD|nr:hypothetical protein BCV72DRAFT_300315 [Rhizopus microsporus var. microsporus]